MSAAFFMLADHSGWLGRGDANEPPPEQPRRKPTGPDDPAWLAYFAAEGFFDPGTATLERVAAALDKAAVAISLDTSEGEITLAPDDCARIAATIRQSFSADRRGNLSVLMLATWLELAGREYGSVVAM